MDFTDDAPALRVKPEEENVSFTFVASDNKIVIDLNEEPAKVEGCTLNFTVRDVHDRNGNLSEPVTWSAFVNQNPLMWKESSVSCVVNATEGATLTATLVNKSGKQQVWTMSTLPSWLQADMTYGDLDPLAEQTITFTVSESTPIGKYERTVYVAGNDGIETPLTLNVTIMGNVPDWAVNANDYEMSMNIIGRLDILGTLSNDENDLVAAFIGEECRGVAHSEYNKRFDGYFVTMDIYGNGSESGQEVTFRAYDASTGTIYPVIVATPTITYAPLGLAGKYDTPVELAVVNKIEQATELKKGWNWLSLYVTADNMNATTIFDKVKGDVLTVKAQNPADGALAKGVNGELAGTMTTLDNTKMYAVQMAANRTLRIVGQPVSAAANKVEVYEGYNWIGYYGQQVASVTDALADFSPQND